MARSKGKICAIVWLGRMASFWSYVYALITNEGGRIRVSHYDLNLSF
jgi:hypothetical protein